MNAISIVAMTTHGVAAGISGWLHGAGRHVSCPDESEACITRFRIRCRDEAA